MDVNAILLEYWKIQEKMGLNVNLGDLFPAFASGAFQNEGSSNGEGSSNMADTVEEVSAPQSPSISEASSEELKQEKGL